MKTLDFQTLPSSSLELPGQPWRRDKRKVSLPEFARRPSGPWLLVARGSHHPPRTRIGSCVPLFLIGQRATYFDLVQYTSKQYRPSRSPTTRTDVPARLPGVSPTHPGHTCQRASPHDAHVVTGRTHHLSSPSWSSLRRR